MQPVQDDATYRTMQHVPDGVTLLDYATYTGRRELHRTIPAPDHATSVQIKSVQKVDIQWPINFIAIHINEVAKPHIDMYTNLCPVKEILSRLVSGEALDTTHSTASDLYIPLLPRSPAWEKNAGHRNSSSSNNINISNNNNTITINNNNNNNNNNSTA
ncbi:hypothetical protein FHG87_001531 [Trinorchestia longiramus]|nr:hypothetical protein FHG87_001531 [Trinorchestia longiramus]